jgi:hypothetical protein
MSQFITAALEGPVDRAVLEHILADFNLQLHTFHGLRGKEHLRHGINAYNNAARHASWTVLVDLDREADCAPASCRAWLPDPARGMCFQVVVRSVEAWLLADGERLAGFLHAPRSRVPADPEQVENPKRAVVDLARHSRKQDIHRGMVPRPSSGTAVGVSYTTFMMQFVRESWRPSVAERRSASLERCRRRLNILAQERL